MPVNRRGEVKFRNKYRRVSLNQKDSAMARISITCVLQQQKGEVTMTDRDPFAEGEHAARQNIPAEANPYSDGSDEHALWSAGHEKIASAMEASESEGT